MDAEGARLSMKLSVDKGLLGVSLFAFGYDDEAVWTGIAEIDASLETTVPDGETAVTAAAATIAAPTEPPTTGVAVATAPESGPPTTGA